MLILRRGMPRLYVEFLVEKLRAGLPALAVWGSFARRAGLRMTADNGYFESALRDSRKS